MAWLWLGLVSIAAGIVLMLTRRFFGQQKLEERIAAPLALVERSCEDALAEMALHTPLPLAREPRLLLADSFPPEPGRFSLEHESRFISVPFEPSTDALAHISRHTIAALGHRAMAHHASLVDSMRAWNTAAGQVSGSRALLPLVLATHRAAQGLGKNLNSDALAHARASAQARVLMSIVTPPPNASETVH